MFKNKLSKASFAALLAFSALPVTAAHATTEGTSLTTQVKGADVSYKAALEDAAALTYANDKNVSFSSYDAVTYLARANYPVAKNYYDTYYNAVEKAVANNFDGFYSIGVYEKTIVALRAIGKDATNVAGVNLVEHMLQQAATLKEKNTLTENDVFWLLLATDASDLTASDASISLQTLVTFLEDKQFENGGFSWSSENEWGQTPSVDTTALAITALAPYATQNEAVQQMIERGFAYISSEANDRIGFFSSYANGDSSDSVAQLIVAQTAMQINPQTDTNFVKNGHWSVRNLLSSYDPIEAGFQLAPNNVVDGYSTKSATLALTAYDLYKTKTEAFYDFSHVEAANLAVDEIAPNAPKVKTTVSDKTIAIEGLSEKYATVTIKNGTKTVGSTLVNGDGSWHIKLSKQVAGTSLRVVTTDTAGNASAATSITVLDKTAPNVPTITTTVSDRTTTISGTAEKGATVVVKNGTKTIATTKAASSGKWSVKIPKQKAKTTLTITATDAAKNQSVAKKVILLDRTAPTVPKVNAIKKGAKKITGTTEKGATVVVKIGSKSYKKTVSTTKFSITVPALKAKQIVKVYAVDAAKNQSKTVSKKVN